MAELRKIITEVLREIKPTNEERKRLEALSLKVLEVAKGEAGLYKATSILAGSLTRDTWLPSKKEFDLFVVFPEKMGEDELEKNGLEVGKRIIEKLGGKWKVDYAQHPYITGTLGDIDIDIVPCYKVESGKKIKSAVDRTPFHVEYLNKRLPIELSDHVRLLKHFLKANGIYGADSKTGGFSGYICELLVINYGTFEDFLKNVSRWDAGEIIDIEGQWPKKDYEKLRKKFENQVLILIDPVDKNRNAAAAVSANSLFKLKKIATNLLDNPGKTHFEKKEMAPLTQKEVKKIMEERGTELLVVNFKPPKVVSDILWPQLKRFTKRLENIMNEYEFYVLRSDFWSNEIDMATVILELEVGKVSKVNKKVGPSVFDKKGSESFIKKYKGACVNGPFIEEDFWCAEVNRKWDLATDKLTDSLEDEVTILKAKGVPNYIAEELKGGFEILKGESIAGLMKYSSDFAVFLRGYFEKEDLS